jgi:hypothetical protein
MVCNGLKQWNEAADWIFKWSNNIQQKTKDSFVSGIKFRQQNTAHVSYLSAVINLDSRHPVV